jgi:putative ABC transport system permease protein
MISLVVAHLRRRSGRSLLTATGIAVGVGAIVALLALTAGLERRAGELVHLGRADLGLFQRNAADLTTSVLPLALVDRLRARGDVADATPIQLLVEGIPSEPSSIVFGGDPEGFLADRLVMVEGRRAFGPRDIMVGDRLAERLEVRPGDPLPVHDRTFTVAGVYHTGIFFEDAGAIVDLRVAQDLAGRRRDEATIIAVALEPQIVASDAERALRDDLPSVTVLSDPEEAARAGANSLLISKAMPLIVVLALIVGGLFVANTMVMAVLERRGEIALLSAVGWSPFQLGALVMVEAVAVSVAGATAGVALGMAAGEALPRALGLLDFIEPHLTAWALGRGLLVGVAIGVLGGLYPTWRASRVDPAGVLARA